MNKFYENLKNQCPFCRQYLVFYVVKESERFRYKSCANCGFKRKTKIPFAHYKHKDGKTFLKTQDHDFLEVKIREGIIKGKRFLKVMPVGNKLL